MLGLRRVAQVTHHRNADAGHRLHGAQHLGAASLELHAVGTRLLHHASAVRYRLLCAHLIGEKRHVHREQRTLHTPPCCRRVVDHLIERHWNRRVVAQQHGAGRVAHEHDVDAALVHETREQRIVRGEYDQFFGTALPCAHVANADALDARLACSTLAAHRVSAFALSSASSRSQKSRWPSPGCGTVRSGSETVCASNMTISKSSVRGPHRIVRSRFASCSIACRASSSACGASVVSSATIWLRYGPPPFEMFPNGAVSSTEDASRRRLPGSAASRARAKARYPALSPRLDPSAM